MRWLLALLWLLAGPCCAQVVSIGESGTNHVVKEIYVGEGGTNHTVISGYIGTVAGNKLFFSALTVAASPTSVSGARATPGTAVSNSSTATASGGLGSYTYSWTDEGAAAITNPTAAITTFSAAVSCSNTVVSDNATVTATDTSTGITARASVSVMLSFTGTPC
jgi:hypothetical protein